MEDEQPLPEGDFERRDVLGILALNGSRFGWVGEDVGWEEIGGRRDPSPLARRNRNSGSVFSGSW